MLIRMTLRYLPAQVLAPLAQLASMIAWTHWLAPEQMGAFTLIGTTQELAYLACLSWFSVYALRTLPGTDGDTELRRRYLRTESAVVAGASLLLVVLALLCVFALPAVGHPWLALPSIAFFFITRAWNAHYAERARAQSDHAAYTLLQSVGPIGGLALGWLALHRFEPSATVLWACYGVAQALGTALALPRLGMEWRLARPDDAVMRAAIGFGAPMLGLSALGWVAENHLRYLVQWQSGAVTLGLMAVGWSLGRRCASVASMLVTTAAFPIASRLLNEGRRGEAIAQLGVNAALLLAVTLPVCAGLAFIGPAVVELLVAPAYREATIAVLALSVASGAVRCLHVHVTDQWLVLERQFKQAAWIDVVEIAACGIASIAGLAYAGLVGAVAGQLLGSLIAFGVSLFMASRRGLRWPWQDTAKVIVGTAAMSFVLARSGTAPTAIGIAESIAIGAVVYIIVMALCYSGLLRSQILRLKRRPRGSMRPRA